MLAILSEDEPSIGKVYLEACSYRATYLLIFRQGRKDIHLIGLLDTLTVFCNRSSVSTHRVLHFVRFDYR